MASYQRERLVDAGVHLHRRPPGWRVSVVTSRAPAPGTARCSEGGQRGIRKHLHRSGFHQRGQIGHPAGVLPDVPTVRHRDVGAGSAPNRRRRTAR